MRYWDAPQRDVELLTSPMVATIRVPLDDAVGGEDFHSHLARDSWEIMHFENVIDVVSRINEQGLCYLVNFTCSDRFGRVLATQR